MMKEKKEFPKGEFSGFRCALECSETRCVFSLWLDSLFIAVGVDFYSCWSGLRLDSLFIVVGVDLGLMSKIFLIYIFYIFWIFFAFNPSFSYLQAVNKKNINS